MRKTLLPSLTLLAIFITACGQQTPPASPAPTLVISTKTATPPATSTSTSIPPTIETDTATPASNDTATNSTPSAGVSFKMDVSPIFENSCNKCHGVEQVKEGLDTRTYETLMDGSFNGAVISPGNAADSLLVEKILNGKMPKRGNKLTNDQIQIITDWINAGAINN